MLSFNLSFFKNLSNTVNLLPPNHPEANTCWVLWDALVDDKSLEEVEVFLIIY